MTVFAHLLFLRAFWRPILAVAGVAVVLAAVILGLRAPLFRAEVVLEASTEGGAEWAQVIVELGVVPLMPGEGVTAKRRGRLVQLVGVSASPGPTLRAVAGWLEREAAAREQVLAEARDQQVRARQAQEWQTTLAQHAELERQARARVPTPPSAVQRAASVQAAADELQRSEQALAGASILLAPYWTARALRALDQQEALRADRAPQSSGVLPLPVPRPAPPAPRLTGPAPLVLVHVATPQRVLAPWAVVLGGAALSGALVAWLGLLLRAWWQEQRARGVQTQEWGIPGTWVKRPTIDAAHQWVP